MKIKLKGVQETLLIPLWARAVELKQTKPIILDSKALEIMEQIDYNFSNFDEEWPTQLSVVIRTEILDRAAQKFMDEHKEGVVLNLGCGLDTRFSRLLSGNFQWFDIDLPGSIDLRRKFFKETEQYHMIAKSIFDYSWFDEIPEEYPVLIIAEGLLMYFQEQEVVALMDKLTEKFSDAEVLIETVPSKLVKKSQDNNLIKKQYNIDANFYWGLAKGRDIENLNIHIKFIEDWHYFDYHRDMWRMIRWLSLIPTFKARFGNRIIHLKFLK